MGRANVIVDRDLRARLYDEAALRAGVYILRDMTYGDDGRHYLEIVSDKLPPGYHGMQDLIVEGGEVRFKKDCDV